MIKLGHTWFNEKRIDGISPSTPPLGLIQGANGECLKPVRDSSNAHYVYVRMEGGSHVTVAYFDKHADAVAYADSLAALVNGEQVK